MAMGPGLRLYATTGSLYSAKVRIALACKGLEWDEVEPEGGYRSAAYRQLVPRGTVPALEIDGHLLVDSEAIIEYIEEVYPAPPLLPVEPLARAHIRSLSRFHDTALEPAVRALFPAMREKGSPAAASVERIKACLAIFARIANPSPLLAGTALCMADCGYPVTFATLEIIASYLGIDLDWPPAVLRYRAALENVAAVGAVLIPYRDITTKWAQSARGVRA